MTPNDIHKYITDQNGKLVDILKRNTSLPGGIQEKIKDAASWIAFAADNLICDPGRAFAAVAKARLEIDTVITRVDFYRAPRLQVLEILHNLGDSYFSKSLIDNALSKRREVR